jgi:hypothetical protein
MMLTRFEAALMGLLVSRPPAVTLHYLQLLRSAVQRM